MSAEVPESMARPDVTETERCLNLHSVVSAMSEVMPRGTRISADAKRLMQELASEHIAFITSEANSLCDAGRPLSVANLITALRRVDLGEFAELAEVYEQTKAAAKKTAVPLPSPPAATVDPDNSHTMLRSLAWQAIQPRNAQEPSLQAVTSGADFPIVPVGPATTRVPMMGPDASHATAFCHATGRLS